MKIKKFVLLAGISTISSLLMLLDGENVQAHQVVCDAHGQCFVTRTVCNQSRQCWQRKQEVYGHFNNGSSYNDNRNYHSNPDGRNDGSNYYNRKRRLNPYNRKRRLSPYGGSRGSSRNICGSSYLGITWVRSCN